MEDWLPLAVHLVRGVFGTARSIEATVRQRESLITLGTLSAGLAHELNNPAAAAVRTVESMGETLNALLHSLGELAEGAITADQFLALDRLRRQIGAAPPIRTPMQLSDAEDELGALAGGPRRRRPVDAGLDAGRRRTSPSPGRGRGRPAARGRPDRRPRVGRRHALGRVRSSRSCARRPAGCPSSSTRCARTRRWTAPPSSPSTSSRASRAPLVMLQHKLKQGVEVVREYDADLPRIDAYAGELNQVWTNLIDNAVDAMDGVGTLRITTRAEADAVVVEIADTGAGLDRRGRRPRLRRVLHDQGRRQGHRPRPRHRPPRSSSSTTRAPSPSSARATRPSSASASPVELRVVMR